MMTTEIISTIYKGVKLQAIGSFGCKYTITCITNEGKQWYTGKSTVKEANEYFAKHEEIRKAVLYIYHPKKHTFEVRKYYER